MKWAAYPAIETGAKMIVQTTRFSGIMKLSMSKPPILLFMIWIKRCWDEIHSPVVKSCRWLQISPSNRHEHSENPTKKLWWLFISMVFVLSVFFGGITILRAPNTLWEGVNRPQKTTPNTVSEGVWSCRVYIKAIMITFTYFYYYDDYHYFLLLLSYLIHHN